MDLRYSEEHERFRAEVRAFLAASWPLRGEEARLGLFEAAARFRARAIAKGYLARSVPRAYGGSEQPSDALRSAIIREEFAGVAAPLDVPAPAAQLIPTLLQHGSEEQKRTYLPRTLTGELRWCQGYSEPNAGSDLANVQTRAELVGGEWVIRGQKIWTSFAQDAQMIYMLVRTEPASAGKHAGISYLLVDLAQPGIDIRPLRGISGEAHFNEIFFDGAVAPADRLVGQRGRGWIVSRATLFAERNVVGSARETLEHFESVVALAKRAERGGPPAIRDPLIRQRLIEIEGFVRAQEYSGLRQLTSDARGEAPGLIDLVTKLAGSDIASAIGRLALDLAGDAALGEPRRTGAARGWNVNEVARYLVTIGGRIGGGTSNIQRNIIGEQGLGLPRDASQRRAKRAPSS
jgi:alkylation response protein AidB-like acyl-CoA dehydrogenase